MYVDSGNDMLFGGHYAGIHALGPFTFNRVDTISGFDPLADSLLISNTILLLDTTAVNLNTTNVAFGFFG
jgi:hypothetical protein